MRCWPKSKRSKRRGAPSQRKALPDETKGRQPVAKWTTQIDRNTHVAYFLLPGDPAGRPTMFILIPECETQLAFIAADGKRRHLINRPEKNLNVKFWLRAACQYAVEIGATFCLVCDTAEQAEYWAQKAASLLSSEYRRAALERLLDPAARNLEALN
jgi:hypothetical protein